MTSTAQDPARVSRRRRKHERQAVIFGLLLTFLVLTGLGALAIYTDTIEAPFAEPIYTPATTATAMRPACLPESESGTPPLPYDKVRVRIYNAADARFALAGANEEVLSERGFDVRDSGDFSRTIEGLSEIRYGAKGVVAAYTLAAQFPDIELILDDRNGRYVDLVVGTSWVEPLPVEEVPLAADQPMQSMAGCQPVDELTPIAREYGRGRDPLDEAPSDDA